MFLPHFDVSTTIKGPTTRSRAKRIQQEVEALLLKRKEYHEEMSSTELSFKEIVDLKILA